MWTWWLITGFVILVLMFKVFLAHDISVDDAAEKLKNGALLIDTRTKGEFDSGHVTGAINLPLHAIQQAPETEPDKNKQLVLYCHGGGRAAIAASKLRAMGYADVANVGSVRRAKKALDQAQS